MALLARRSALALLRTSRPLASQSRFASGYGYTAEKYDPKVTPVSHDKGEPGFFDTTPKTADVGEDQFLCLPLDKADREYFDLDGKEVPAMRLGIRDEDLDNERASSTEAALIRRALSYDNGSANELSSRYYKLLESRFGRTLGDCGNTDIDIIRLHHRQKRIDAHRRVMKKDSRAIWIKDGVEKRLRRNLMHLRKKDFGRYKRVITYCGMEDKFTANDYAKFRKYKIEYQQQKDDKRERKRVKKTWSSRGWYQRQ